jgi:hypothetical protein
LLSTHVKLAGYVVDLDLSFDEVVKITANVRARTSEKGRNEQIRRLVGINARRARS